MPADVIAHIASLPIAPDLATEVIRLQKIYDRGIHTPFGSEHDRIPKAFTSELQVIGNATIERAVLRAIYDPAQLKEQMRWFWFNHFNVLLWDATVHAMIADYEDKAIRPHALGKFRDLLGVRCAIRLCCAFATTPRTPRRPATRITRASCTQWGSGRAMRSRMCRLARILTGVGYVSQADPPKLDRGGIRNGLFQFDSA